MSPTGLSPAVAARSRDVRLSARFVTPTLPVLQPRPKGRFGLFPVRSPLLGE